MAEGAELRVEILEAALAALEDGVAVLDAESRVLLWNPAAMAIAGYLAADLLSRELPVDFCQVAPHHLDSRELRVSEGECSERPLPVILRHEKGHTLPVMLRRAPLRNALGKRCGTMLRFHPVEEVDTLAHGVNEEEGLQGKHLEHSQADMEDRLEEACHEWTSNGIPYGLLWITVDRATGLRRTHGRDAAEAMLTIVERTLLHALRPAEIMGRWGSNEFLVLCHERSAEMLAAHGEHVAALARTADFRWWGDRVRLTVSVGAAQASDAEKLSSLLIKARAAMRSSELGGGDRVTISKIGGQECSQS